ncbi:MAG TPA: hypothetical protein VEI02_14490 [Planctomycetota bacterium]|nr:hypothetical protein [Planctomycetota bacterium]
MKIAKKNRREEGDPALLAAAAADPKVRALLALSDLEERIRLRLDAATDRICRGEVADLPELVEQVERISALCGRTR